MGNALPLPIFIGEKEAYLFSVAGKKTHLNEGDAQGTLA